MHDSLLTPAAGAVRAVGSVQSGAVAKVGSGVGFRFGFRFWLAPQLDRGYNLGSGSVTARPNFPNVQAACFSEPPLQGSFLEAKDVSSPRFSASASRCQMRNERFL